MSENFAKSRNSHDGAEGLLMAENFLLRKFQGIALIVIDSDPEKSKDVGV